MARPSNTVARQKQIKDALLAVMAVQGFEAATILKIAKAAKLAPGVVHYHFASKEEILLALVRDLTQLSAARYAAAKAATGESARERLHAFVDGQLALDESADPRAAAAWAAVGAEASRHPKVARLYRSAIAEAHRELQVLFAAALPRRAARAAEYAASTLAAIEGCFHLAFAAPNVLVKGSAAATVKILVDGLLEKT